MELLECTEGVVVQITDIEEEEVKLLLMDNKDMQIKTSFMDQPLVS